MSRTNDAAPRSNIKHVQRVAHASRWAQLDSSDLAVYAANLRAAGCPEKTLRDILLPLVEEKFEHAKSPLAEPTNFWASFSERQTAAAAGVEQETAVRRQKDEILKELFGFAWTSEGLNQSYQREAAASVGFLDFEHAEKLLCIAGRFENQFSRAHRVDRRAALHQLWRQEVGAVLSPSEIEETELRGLLMLHQRRNPNLCKVGLSGSELRQLMVYRHELCNPLPSALLAGGDELLQELDWTGEQQINVKVRLLMGDDRFLNYLKCSDFGVARTLSAVEKQHLPRSLALQLFDLRQEAMARAQEIRQLPVGRAEKRAELAALRQSAREQLESLPDAADNVLIRINQDWLQEIGNP